jgi:predicted DNA-binding transcriptional regulator AlpA
MPDDGDRYIRPDDLAARLAISARQVRRWRQDGDGPPYIRLGHNTVRYRLGEVQRWEQSRREGGGDGA